MDDGLIDDHDQVIPGANAVDEPNVVEVEVTDSEEDDHPEDVDNAEILSDSGESDGVVFEVELSDSSEDSEPVSEDEDEAVPHHNDMFEEFFHLNVERAGFNQPLLAQGNVQQFEKLILDIAKALRYKESYVSMVASFRIANMEFDNAHFPTMMKGFWEIVNRNLGNFAHSIFCTQCGQDLGVTKKPTRNCRCGLTGPGKTNEMGTFLYMNLPAQLQGLLSKPRMATDLEYPWTRRKHNPAAIEDVYDASVYRQLSTDDGFLCRGNHNYSLAIWTDGVDPVVSAPVTIWPVFVQVLELSPRARQRNSLLAALYVGPRKPPMAQFLTPFTRQLQSLYLNGISWRPDGGGEIRSRFVPLIIAADSEARYLILGMMRHNAYWGCTYCYARGDRVGDRHQYHIYRYNDNENGEGPADDRTNADIRHDATLAAANGQPERGIQAISALSIVPTLDLRTCQSVEALHCLWERNLTRLYCLFTNPEMEDYITPAQIRIISNRIESVKPPTKLARRPRALEKFAKYKGTEYRNLAWYYWLPCAHDFMTVEQIDHFSLFAEFTYIVNKDSILPEELVRASRLIDRFREQSEEMFPERYQTYSLHLLKHVIRCVEELGPLWVASGFWFESLNRQIKNYITSATDRTMQIACRILLAQMVEKTLDWDLSPDVLNMLREFLHKARWVVPPENATGTFVRHGRATPGFLNQEETVALRAAGYADINEQTPVTRQQRVCINGVMYQPEYDRPVKYDNSVVHVTPLGEGDASYFVRIMSIIRWQNAGERMKGIIGRRFITVGPAFNTTYMKIVQESEELVYLPLECIKGPSVLVESSATIYVSPIPNRWDVD